MTIAEHFDRFVAARVRIDALRRQLRELEDEAKPDEAFVRDWFRSRPERRRFRGVNYAKTFQKRIDAAKARLLLGARASQAEREVPIETLTLDYESKAVRDAGSLAKPMRRIERASA